MKIRPVRAELFHVERETKIDTIKLLVSLRYFGDGPITKQQY